MGSKAKILLQIILLSICLFAQSDVDGPLYIVGSDPKLYVPKTPSAASVPDSFLVKLPDNSIGTYPLSFTRTMISGFWAGPFWDSIPDKPSSFTPKLHHHDSLYYRKSEVTTIVNGKEPAISTSTSDKFWNGLKQWVNITIGNVLGLNDTITNHRTAIASKLNISDTSSLARKNHGHSQSQITGLVDTVTAHRNAINNKQPLDTDLTTIAALTHSNRHVMVSNGSSWTRRALEEADLPSLSAAKITSGTLDNARLSFNPNCFVQGINSRRSVILGSASPLDSNKHSTFFTMYSSDPTYDSRLSGHGIGFRSQHGESDGYALDMIGNTYGDGTLLFGGVYNNVRQPWRAIWHSGNFNPADYQPAISGTAYKVLSIQSDGSGVKTGCLRDLGNYAAIDNAERFAIIHSTDQAAISLQSQGGNRFWISSAPSVLNIGGAGTTAPENGQLQIYHNSRVVIPSLPLLVGKATATTGNPYKIEVEGNALVNGKLVLGTRPANDHFWQLAVGDRSTITQHTDNNFHLAYNAYYDGANWRRRVSGIPNYLSMSGNGVFLRTGATGAANSVIDPQIYSILSYNGNTAFGKNTLVGGYKVEVEGNAFINGNETITGSIDVGGNLQTRNNISLLNKAGNGWLSFVTRNVSGSEAVADLTNVGSITPAGSALTVKGDVFLWNKLQMINRAGTAWDVIDRETGGNGIGARLKSIVKLNDMNVADGGFSRNGNISIGGNRVVMSRRNVGTAATINITTNPQIIDLNSYAGISRFDITTSMTDAPVVYFQNATEGDEIFVKIVEAGQYASEYGIGLGWNIDPHDGTWMKYATKRYFHLICEGTATASGVTANKWWIAGVHGLYSP